jgi:hypothetical protein
MSSHEIAHKGLSEIAAYERGQLSRFDLAVVIEGCGEELRLIDTAAGTRLKGMAMRLAASEFVATEPADGVVNEMKMLLSSLDGQA